MVWDSGKKSPSLGDAQEWASSVPRCWAGKNTGVVGFGLGVCSCLWTTPAGRRAEIETGFCRKIPGNTGEGAAAEPQGELPNAPLDQWAAVACGGGRGSGANPCPHGPGCTGYPRAQTRGQVSRIRRQEASYSLLPLLFSRLHPQEEPSHRFGGVFLGHCSLGKNSFCFFAFTHIDLFLLLLLIIWQIFVQLLFSLQEALQISMTFVTLKR